MNLDDLARDAAARVRRDAADLGRIDLDRFRRRRQLRNGLAFGTAGLVVLTAALALFAVTPPLEKVAVTVSTTPEGTTSTTVTSPATTIPSEAPGLLGAGWELIDARTVAGRQGAAVVWTEDGLVVWGGVGPASAGASGPFLYRGGSIRDSATGIWRSMAPVEVEGLCGGEGRALSVGDRILFYGATAPTGDCALAAVYHPGADAWFPVESEFAVMITRDTALVWTGELVVAPEIGITYDLHAGETRSIPEVPDRLDDVVASPLRAHWTGTEVLAVGSGPVYAWTPGDTEWRSLGTPPVPSTGRNSVWAGELWVVTADMLAVSMDGAGSWTSQGPIPLTFEECVPDLVAVTGTPMVPVVRTCSGIAIWDETRLTWVVAPLERPGWGVQSSGALVVAESEQAIYSVGTSIYRYQVIRDESGAIASPLAFPIGRMELGELDPWVFNRSYVSGATVGVALTGPSFCTVYSTEGEWTAPTEFVAAGEITIHNPGRALLDARLYRSADDATRFGVAIDADPDTVFVRCDGGVDGDEALLSEHASRLASRLWWPDRPLVAPTYTSGPGWDALDAGPIEGRMRIAAAWTGEELFVWGGHDGYIQETPGPEHFYQGAYLFDPATGEWRPAAPPPDDLCAFTEAEVIPLDEEVLLRGLAPDRDGCSQAAIYTPADDAWRVVDSPLFDVFYFRTDLVWTGEWLAAPRAGLAWVPSENETIGLPSIPDGASVLSRVDAHWTGDRIVALGGGDVYTLTPGEESWVSISGPPIQEGGRVSVWYSDGLWAAEHDHGAALLDRSLVLIDQLPRWYYSSLPLRNDECFVELLLAGDRPVAATCVGMAIWDDFWVPIPAGETGWAWQPTLVGSDDAIYSIGEGFHRFPIAVDSEGGLDDPATILIGEAFLDMGEFRISSTIGLSRVEYPDGSIGEAIAVELEGPGGSCRVTSTYQGPPLGEPESVFAPSGFLVLVFDSSNGMTDWAVRTGDGDVVRIHCESEEDAMTLVQSLWGISYPQT